MCKQLYTYLLLFIVLPYFTVNAQQTSVEITGKVLESTNNQPIEYATISVIDHTTKKPITGTVTNANGTFSIKVETHNFYIEVSFMGYTTKRFNKEKFVGRKINLGTILLSEDQHALDEIVVNAEKSQTEFKLDKRIFNVGTDLSNTGASALEVLNNVPSVNVNIEGEISLRGSSGVQILINGKPSVLSSAGSNALGTITADMIEQIEVITNPSAKYEASGTGGIINIIMKKSEKRGLNGSVSLNAGVPNSNSFGMSLNKRTEHFNIFSQMGFGRRTYPEDNKTINSDLTDNTTVSSVGKREMNEKFKNFILGTDYHINALNVLTLSGSYAYEIEDQNSKANYNETDITETITDSWLREETTEATNPKLSYELQYKKNFKRHKDQSLLFSAIGSSFKKDESSIFNNTTILGDEPDETQLSRTDYALEDYTFKLDYTHPFLEVFTLETGSQYAINKVTNDYAVDGLGDVFNFNQNVLGIYNTLAYEGEIWGIKLGLRLENTETNTLLKTSNVENSKSYTNLFPTIHTSYKFSENTSFQAGYSKRINRPSLRELNPFSNIRNNFSISTGNPDLQPEYTDSFEITTIHKFEKASLNFSFYNRYTEDVIERVNTFEDGVNTSKPENIGTNNTSGLEMNGKYNPIDWFSLNGDFNWNHFNRKGDFETTSFDFKGNRWSASLTSKFNLPARFDLEISGNYNSSFKTFQNEISDNLFADVGLRKKIFKGKTILNISVRDLFASRVDETTTTQPTYYLYNSRKRGRFITFGISYGFGKGEAMEFSGQRIR
ncbi:outer membrane receptor for ferrienterochelin and colicin [Mariniflexile fucanivorans]|uniref:Outer membrane receptor for ferrienterochelin and colicin n=1 Tax=Mariniflexile fucanivorans TaxID=264023 RepID=A0A4R1RG23_9FLAO|nr:outer membrane beta-barrel family protein [Mariniflexile fucanivorans]TCL64913.1 outer membrane receptor for ferrienterochelin and colicin [Mariniflexile fucanivorans]